MPHVRITVDGETRWRWVERADHGELCRAANLDPVRHRFDVIDRFGEIQGYVFRDGQNEPVGTVSPARAGRRLRDVDPTNESDRLSLRQYVNDRS